MGIYDRPLVEVKERRMQTSHGADFPFWLLRALPLLLALTLSLILMTLALPS